jgi:hypothetical protein
MTSGRNEVCHCGSGKKYEKCCLQKDQLAQQEKFARIPSERRELASADSARTAAILSGSNPLPPTPEPPPDPRVEAMDARWSEFQDSDSDDQRRQLFIKTLDEPELVDSDFVFEMLNSLYERAVESGERDQWADLVDQLRERFPDIYHINRKYYLKNLIVSALAGSRPENLLALGCEMAETAGADVDLFAKVVDSSSRIIPTLHSQKTCGTGTQPSAVSRCVLTVPRGRDSENGSLVA